MNDDLTWIVGRGGMLGQSLGRHLYSVGSFRSVPISWTSDDALPAIADEADRFLTAARDRPWRVVWCAGAGIIGTSRTSLDQETAVLRSLLDRLRSPGTVFLTSSAGGVYGGSRDIPITEQTPVAPRSDYGANKLAQEELVRQWASASGGRAVIGRVANLYGPGQLLTKPQGLVSQICLATLLRRPVSVYVSLDTLRDYLFVDDCSRMIGRCLDAAEALEPGSVATKILATGSAVSIGALLSQARRVLGRSPAVVMIPSGRATQQGSTLAFRSTVWPEMTHVTLTPLPVGIHRTCEHLRRQLQLGTLA